MKDLGFYFYDLVLIFNVNVGNGLNLPLSTLHFAVNYKNPKIDRIEKMKEIENDFTNIEEGWIYKWNRHVIETKIFIEEAITPPETFNETLD